MARLFLASLVTFGLILGMVVGLVLGAMVAFGEIELGLAITLAVVINLVIWLISPWLSDWSLRWFNKMEFLDDATVKQRYPGIHALTHEVANEYRFSAPRIGFIPDRNPTAFTYGLLRSNARIVVTQGIFEFLDEEEQRAVVAHELGHIVNRDFILMTMAGMLVQILYMIYVTFSRAKHFDQEGVATGWFRRGMGGYLILRELKSTAGSLRAKPFFWQVVLSLIVIIGNVVVVSGS
ncbi:MAG: M48 family metalloprotease [Methyloceanibacter sp.]|uniref:M48 family metalloprotease n=1 Tax=Methyloceanibacter sp. TaxID=1965321 RepID=UPI003D6D04A6